MLNPTYRIQISPRSNYYLFLVLVVILTCILSLWTLPYYLPFNFKLLINIIACLAFVLCVLIHLKNELTVVMSLSDNGELIYRSNNLISGELRPQSQSLFLAYILEVKQALNDKPIRIVIYKDQIDDTANRRLNRIIKQTKFMAQE